MTSEFAEEAEGEGISVSEARVRGRRSVPSRVRGADLVYYGGTAERALPLLERIVEAAPGADLMATDALLLGTSSLAGAGAIEDRLLITSAAQDPSQLPEEGQRMLDEYRREFGARPGRYVAYGYEAMALVLDSIQRAGDRGRERQAVIDEMLATRDRRSVLGTYSIEPNGSTSLDAVAGYRVEGGEPVFETALSPP